MKISLVLLLALTGFGCVAAEQKPGGATKYYVQLVRGSDDATPPQPGAKLVGLKVAQQLQPIFRWKNYWEVQRATVSVENGKAAQTDLQEGLSLEVDLHHPTKRTIRIFRGKKLVRAAVCRRDEEFCIQGFKPFDGTVWFVIVRSDPPAT